MSSEKELSLGLHGFFRYSIPGFVYLLVFLGPIYLMFDEVVSSALLDLIPSLGSFEISALLVISGPIIGYLIFHLYYVQFKKWCYTIKERPFEIIKSQALKIHENMGDKSKQLSEFDIRALEDYAVHFYVNEKFEPLRKRLDFLFSAFHSLGATVLAIWLGIASWIFFGFFNVIISWSLILPSGRVLVAFAFFAIFWLIISRILLSSWKFRKELATKEEAFLAAIARNEIGEVIEANKKIDELIQLQEKEGACASADEHIQEQGWNKALTQVHACMVPVSGFALVAVIFVLFSRIPWAFTYLEVGRLIGPIPRLDTIFLLCL